MNIAVYSGSFNPLHIGHLAIMKYLTGEGGFDCVYLIVSPKNPLKDGISSESGQARYEAAIAAVKRHFHNEEVRVDDIELTMPEPHYTIRTLDACANASRETDSPWSWVPTIWPTSADGGTTEGFLRNTVLPYIRVPDTTWTPSRKTL